MQKQDPSIKGDKERQRKDQEMKKNECKHLHTARLTNNVTQPGCLSSVFFFFAQSFIPPTSDLPGLYQFLSMIVLTESYVNRERKRLLYSPGYWLLSRSESPRRVNPKPAGTPDEAQSPFST